MRTFRLIAIFASVFFYLSAYSQDDVVVATDKYLEEATFDKYKTFTFAEHISDESNNNFFQDSELMKTTLRDEVTAELEALGYEYTDDSDADIMVNFQILEEPVEYQGWIDNYADDNYWGKFSLSARTREPSDEKTYNLKKGTLLVQMVDLDKDIVVWTGYASGVMDDSESLDEEGNDVALAVEKIFEEFNFTAPED